MDDNDGAPLPYPPAAGNGLLDRRVFLRSGLGLGAGLALARASAAEPERPPWARTPGAPLSGYGSPSTHEQSVRRDGIGHQPGAPGSGASRTPLERLEGVITPSGLVFERHHSGIPDIDPEAHRLTIHGRVRRPLSFSMDALARLPAHHPHLVSGVFRQQRRHGRGRRAQRPALRGTARAGVRL